MNLEPLIYGLVVSPAIGYGAVTLVRVLQDPRRLAGHSGSERGRDAASTAAEGVKK